MPGDLIAMTLREPTPNGVVEHSFSVVLGVVSRTTEQVWFGQQQNNSPVRHHSVSERCARLAQCATAAPPVVLGASPPSQATLLMRALGTGVECPAYPGKVPVVPVVPCSNTGLSALIRIFDISL